VTVTASPRLRESISSSRRAASSRARSRMLKGCRGKCPLKGSVEGRGRLNRSRCQTGLSGADSTEVSATSFSTHAFLNRGSYFLLDLVRLANFDPSGGSP
jgi:hypothetical protein